ncbi:MAG: NADH-quinone oxidoreductase subunit I [Planctomycetota bacterium]
MSNVKKSKTVKWGSEPKLTVLDALYLPAIASGVATAIRHALSVKPTTRQYPEVKPTIPPNYRGVHRLNRDEQGRVKCVACYMCQTACPANCIEIIAAPAPKDDPHWKDRDKYPATFTIDELRCIYCGMCEEACPVDAIELTSVYDLTGMTREEMIFDKEKLLSVFDDTSQSGNDPVRTNRGALGPASEATESGKRGTPPPGRGTRG